MIKFFPISSSPDYVEDSRLHRKILDGEAIGTKSNQKIEQTKNPAFLQDFEGPTLQGTWFATGTLIIANQKSLSSHHKLRAMEVGEVASPEPRWRTRASLLSTPMAGLLYQGQIENQMKNKN